jgi:glycosyltransferase involved in cell wall biosynthesis
MKISYLITCHNETDTLSRLLFFLCNKRRVEDEIIVLDDFSTEEKTKSILKGHSSVEHNFKIIQHALDNNYGNHKNFGNKQCTGDWIFQIDGDELPSENILGENLEAIIESNPESELIFVPRINDFRGVTEEHAKAWGWRLSESPTYKRARVNFPDFQSRIYRNIPDRIKWDRKLHEKIEGHLKYSFLPTEEEYALYHDKSIQKQIETNLRYNKAFTEAENKGHNVV